MGKIVWIASYPKSGNTWMRAFLWNFLRDANRPGPLEELSRFAVSESHPDRYRSFLGGGEPASFSLEDITRVRPKVQADIAERATNVVFAKSHNCLGTVAGYPLYNMQVTGGAIYIVRNPLDVVVSVADHFGIGVDEAIDFMEKEETAMPANDVAVAEFLASWSTHVASWTTQKHPNILVVRYEDLLARPKKTFTNVLKLLHHPANPNRLNRAIRLSSFQQLQRQEAKEGFVERSEYSRQFFRAGRRDQWRDILSREQIKRLLDRHGEQMKRFGYIPQRY